MGQLVYFSPNKAQQFMTGKRKFPEVAAMRIGTVLGIPFAEASSEVELKPKAPGVVRRIDEIVKQIERSARPSLVHDDPSVQPGDWVQFEEDLCGALVTFGSYRMLFFAPTLEEEKDTILLLYGAPANKIGSAPHQAVVGVRDLDSDYSSLALVVRSAAGGEEEAAFRDREEFRVGAAKMAERVNQHCHSFSSMFGYAQVVTVLNCSDLVALGGVDDAPINWPTRLVVASPLFVEHSAMRSNPGWRYGPEDEESM